MRAALLSSAVLAVVVSFSACSGSPTAPTPKAPDAVVPVPAPAPTPVPDGAQVRTFAFVSSTPAYAVRDYTKVSEFLLNDNGTFTLHYPGIGDYRGTYTEAGGTIVFQWEGGSAAGPWGATGTLVGDKLTVNYNLIMELTDFEDAVYALTK